MQSAKIKHFVLGAQTTCCEASMPKEEGLVSHACSIRRT